MPSYGRTNYGGGGATTSAFGETLPYQGNSATDALQALINSERGGGVAGRQPQGRVAPADLGRGDPNRRLREQAEAAALRRKLMADEAATRSAPREFISGPQIIGGWIDDKNQMNADQRQMFLPQNSTNNPAADAAALATRGEAERDAEEAFQAMVARRQATDRLGTALPPLPLRRGL